MKVRRPQNVIIVNGTNPDAEVIVAKMKETGCTDLAFTGIGKVKAKKLVDAMPRMQIRYLAFRKLANASEEYFKDNNYTVVATIGDFVKGGKKVSKKATPVETLSKEESKDRAERFCNFLRNVGSDISIYGYSFFKDTAEEYGATKTMKRSGHYYAYFGKMYVRF